MGSKIQLVAVFLTQAHPLLLVLVVSVMQAVVVQMWEALATLVALVFQAAAAVVQTTLQVQL
jgi:hypothetical protein